ncbi:MAG: hypothetical protein IJW30_04645 [Clostridia bacterium]|nr:hypothetical protein [Clostridia bacterium]
MKNRRTILVAFLLIAAMTIGVGYAVLTDELKAHGTTGVNVDDAKEVFDEDIYFSKAVIASTTGTATISNLIDDGGADQGTNDYVSITINDGFLKEVGDQAIVTLTVKSESDLAVTMAIPTITNNNSTYFAVTTTWSTETVIAAKGTADIVITVELIKTPTADQDLTFDVVLGATSAAS